MSPMSPALVGKSICPDIVLDSGTSVQDLIAQYDQVLNDVAVNRQAISSKVNAAIAGMDLDPAGDPETLEAQIRLLEQGDKLLQSREKAFMSRIKLRMDNKEADAQVKMYGALTTKILKDLEVNKVSPYVINQSTAIDVDALQRIDQQLAGLEALDFDPGEVRTDHKDMS